MTKVKLDSVFINTTNKEGKPLISKNNDPYTMVVIKWEGKSASMYCDNKRNAQQIEMAKEWSQGQEIEVELEQSGQYLNFKLPSKTDLRFTAIEKRLDNGS